jgi:hypothetical protein
MISSFYESRFTADRLGGGKKCIYYFLIKIFDFNQEGIA